ncbi:hypothetical protein JCM9534A_02580 [Catenuloplanes indicus JCM 9534]
MLPFGGWLPGVKWHRGRDSATFCVTSPEEVAEVSVIPLPTARPSVALVVAVDAFRDRFRADPGTRVTYTATLRQLRETVGDQLPVAASPRRSTSRRWPAGTPVPRTPGTGTCPR